MEIGFTFFWGDWICWDRRFIFCGWWAWEPLGQNLEQVFLPKSQTGSVEEVAFLRTDSFGDSWSDWRLAIISFMINWYQDQLLSRPIFIKTN